MLTTTRGRLWFGRVISHVFAKLLFSLLLFAASSLLSRAVLELYTSSVIVSPVYKARWQLFVIVVAQRVQKTRKPTGSWKPGLSNCRHFYWTLGGATEFAPGLVPTSSGDSLII